MFTIGVLFALKLNDYKNNRNYIDEFKYELNCYLIGIKKKLKLCYHS